MQLAVKLTGQASSASCSSTIIAAFFSSLFLSCFLYFFLSPDLVLSLSGFTKLRANWSRASIDRSTTIESTLVTRMLDETVIQSIRDR